MTHCIQISARADNDEHRKQIIAAFTAADGCFRVRDLHNPNYADRNQLVCAYFPDEPGVPDSAFTPEMRRVAMLPFLH